MRLKSSRELISLKVVTYEAYCDSRAGLSDAVIAHELAKLDYVLGVFFEIDFFLRKRRRLFFLVITTRQRSVLPVAQHAIRHSRASQ
jgi:hypothetical protein